jgi:hypothetical protein
MLRTTDLNSPTPQRFQQRHLILGQYLSENARMPSEPNPAFLA